MKIGDFEILCELSAGGMGKVLLGRKTGLHDFEKLVAVKVIQSRGIVPMGTANGADENEIQSMFLDEARLVARLDHPAIAQVHDFGRDREQLYLVMEYVPGISFADLIRKHPTPEVACRAMHEVCLGLQAAHQLTDHSGRLLGVVHRDVSPDNLMLAFSGRVKILDFGIAFMRDRKSRATQVGQIKGKPAYMSPEQARNQNIDHRSDIFSAAIVLHELLTGRSLFTGDSPYAVARAVESAAVAKPSDLAGVLPQGLDDLVMRGLQKEPGNRFQSAMEMADALDQVVQKSGGESLQHYVRRELEADQQTHQDWLAKTLAGLQQSHPGPAPRPTGVSTMPRAERPKPNWLPGFFLGLGLLVLLIAAVYFAARDVSESGSTPQPPASPADAGIAITTPKPLPEKKPEPPPTKEPGRKPRPARHKKPPTPKPIPPVVQPEKPAPQPETYGFLTVGAEPYAIVRIDGKQVGTTPLIRHRVPVGRHEVVLVHPDTSKQRYRQVVELKENEHRDVIVP